MEGLGYVLGHLFGGFVVVEEIVFVDFVLFVEFLVMSVIVLCEVL